MAQVRNTWRSEFSRIISFKVNLISSQAETFFEKLCSHCLIRQNGIQKMRGGQLSGACRNSKLRPTSTGRHYYRIFNRHRPSVSRSTSPGVHSCMSCSTTWKPVLIGSSMWWKTVTQEPLLIDAIDPCLNLVGRVLDSIEWVLLDEEYRSAVGKGFSDALVQMATKTRRFDLVLGTLRRLNVLQRPKITRFHTTYFQVFLCVGECVFVMRFRLRY